MFSKTPTYYNQTTFPLFILLLVLQLVSFIPTAAAQAPSFCGSFGPFQAPTNNPDSIVFDRFGNTYLRGDLMGNNLGSVTFRDCTAGYFELQVDDSIPAAEEAVICQVFSDVSALILRRQLIGNCGDPVPQPTINIQVGIQVDPNGIEDGRLGVASPFYIPLRDDCSNDSEGVQQSNIMRKLNGEPLRSNPDGVLCIDIDPPNAYYYGDDPNGIDTSQYDLYSIVLHEVMHLVGYSGVTGMDGQPNTAFSFSYSEWDRILHTTTAYDPGGNSQNVTPLLTSNCVDNCYQLNDSTFASIQDFQDAVTGNCTNNDIDIIVGNTGLAPILGGSGNFPNQISHLNPTCGNPNYVMQPSLDTGVVRRTLTIAETNILCELGYQTPDCNGCFMAVSENSIINNSHQDNCCDLFYNACVDQPLLIPINDLLCNDFTNGAELELTSVYAPFSTNTYSVRIVGNNIEFTSSDPGFYIGVNYTVEGCNCKLLNGQFSVNVSPCEIECETSDPCQDILCLNGFEDYQITAGGGASNFFFPDEPFWIDNPNNNSPDVHHCSVTNNTYIYCGNFGASLGTEGFAVPLDYPVDPGCSVMLSLDLSQVAGLPTPASMVVKGSDQYPCTIVGSTIGAACDNADCGGSNQNYTCLGIIQTTSSSTLNVCPVNWNTHQLPWTNDQSYPINVLIFHPLTFDQGGGRNSILVDNITASLSCNNSNITTTHSTSPQATCSGGELAIQYSVCATTNSTQLDYTILLPNGASLVSGNLTGNLNISGGSCEEVSITVALDNGLAAGQILGFALEYTSLGDCAAYHFETVVSDFPDAGFTPSVDCGSVAFTSTDTSSGAIHFWSFGDGQFSSQAAPLNTYGNTGSFTVTHTVTNECGSTTTTQTITIVDLTPPDSDFMFDIENCSTIVNFFSMSMSGETHQWDFDGNFSTIESTDANPVFDFLAPGTYTATHFAINGCSISTSTQIITVEECTTGPCDCPNTITGGLLSKMRLPADTLDNTDTCLSISGTLVVDIPYHITGGEIQMQPGSRIIVSNLQQLELMGVDVHGCDQMWQGIEVRSFGNLTMRQSMIQDAHWGIQAHHWANVDIGRSVFNNNYIGIYTAPTGGFGQFVNMAIANSSFIGTDELLPRYPGQPTTISNRSRSGVELYNTHSSVIGGQRGRPLANSFSGMHYGVYAKDCFGISILRPQIHDLIEVAAGVYLDNSTDIAMESAEISGVDYGLWGLRSSPTISQGNIDSRREGVLLQNGRGRSALIQNIGITSPRTCVFISDYSGSTGQVEVRECTLFKRDGLNAGAAIYVNNCSKRLIIDENPSIAFSKRGFGIWIANSVGPITIEDNPLIYSTGNDFANMGIRLSNVSGAQVYNNYVNNSGNHAIAAFDSPGNLYCCNQVNKARDGVFFGGGCAGTILKNTDFGAHRFGLNMFNAVVSLQNLYGNSWIGADCEVFDAVFNSTDGFSDIFQSRFFTNRTYIPRGHEFIGIFGGGTPQEWFSFEPEFDPHCTFYCDEPPHLLPPHSPCTHLAFSEEINEIDLWAASESGSDDPLSKGVHHREQRHLLKKLNCLPTLQGMDHATDQFYQTAQGASLGQFHEQHQAIQNLFAFSPTEELNVFYNERENLNQYISQLDSIYWSEGIDTIMMQLGNILTSIGQLETTEWQQTLEQAESLSISNQSLSENELYENNEKAINEIILATVAQGIYEFTPEQMNAIETIAEQCPLSDGSAVHIARGLQAIYAPQWYDDQQICQVARERRSAASQANDNYAIQVYPNPVSDILHIQLEKHKEESLVVEFYTIDGRAYRTFSIHTSRDIQLGSWPSGIYFYHITDHTGRRVIQDRLIKD